MLLVIAGLFFFPTFWVFMTSFKTPREYYSMPPSLLPKQFQIFHYKEAFFPWTVDPTEQASNYWVEESAGRVESVLPQILNSFIITAGAVHPIAGGGRAGVVCAVAIPLQGQQRPEPVGAVHPHDAARSWSRSPSSG